MWIMKVVRVQIWSSFIRWVYNVWVEFIDFFKNVEMFDIVIMVFGYILMYLIFVLFFFLMCCMGFNFWFVISVIFLFVFLFFFGLFVIIKFGVLIFMVFLFEGFLFFVVIIGFEKNIVLIRVVFLYVIEYCRFVKGGK